MTQKPKKWQRGKFTYILTTDQYFWPRQLADTLSFSPDFNHFVSIKDLQNDTHYYGDTYTINHEEEA